VTAFAAGLWRWTGRHPAWTPDQGGPEGWPEEVGSYCYEAPDAVVLFDPLVPPGNEQRFWAALDEIVALIARPVAVLLTVHWHARSTAEITARYPGTTVWAPEAAFPEELRGGLARPFRFGGDLPGSVRAIESPGDEAIFWIEEQAALVTGDSILGASDGGLRIPDSWLPDELRGEPIRHLHRPLLALPVERVLVTHGEPVLEQGHAALQRLLAA